MESRTQGSRPRPRTQKKSEAKAKDSLSEDRHSRGQGQECSRPRPRTKDTSASALQKKKKRSSQKFFKRSPQKNVFQKNFPALHKILTIQKIVLSSSRGQTNFRGLEVSRPRPRTSKCVLEDSTSGKHLAIIPPHNVYNNDVNITSPHNVYNKYVSSLFYCTVLRNLLIVTPIHLQVI